jgi:HEPN domain-containing protein
MGRDSEDMTSDLMAESYFEWARYAFKEVEMAFSEGMYYVAVRRAQECIELAMKGVFRLLAIEFPKEHDVSKVMSDISPKLPEWFQKEVDKVSAIVKKLAEDRGPAMYGDERHLKPPGEIFKREDGERALNDSKYVLGLCERFFKEWFKEREVE